MTANEPEAGQHDIALALAGALGVRRRLLWTFGTQSLAILLRVAQQIALVPVLIRYWGTDLYQDWLILFSASGFLSILDLGMQVYFGNALLIAWSHRDVGAYRRHLGIAMCLYSIVLTLGALVLLTSTAFVSWPTLLGASAMTAAAAIRTAGLLSLATLLIIPFGVVMAVYRAHGNYSRGGFIVITAEALRGFGIILVALLGGAPAAAACVYLSVAIVFWIGVLLDQKRCYGEFSLSLALPSRQEAREALVKSAMYLVPTITTPVVMNGPILLLGALSSVPGAVVAYTVSRTFVGFARQVVVQFCQPVGAELTRQEAVGQSDRLRRLLMGIGRIMTGMAGVLGGFTLVAGATFIRIWTHGEVLFDPWIIGAFVATILLIAPAQPPLMMFHYNNRPGLVVFSHAAFATATVILCLLLIGRFAAFGATLGTGLAECAAVGFFVPYVAFRRIDAPLAPYFARCYMSGALAFSVSFGVARGVATVLPADDLIGLVRLGLVWVLVVAVPAFLILLDREERLWFGRAARNQWLRLTALARATR